MKKNTGFTLVEIVVCVALLSIVVTLITQVLFTTTHVNTKTKILTDIKQNGNFAIDIISRMVRSANSIQCNPGPPPVALITNPDGNVTTITCISDGNVMRISSESAHQAYLTPATVTCSSLAFSCQPAAGIQTTLTVSFTLQQAGVAGSAYEANSSSFQSTVSLRN